MNRAPLARGLRSLLKPSGVPQQQIGLGSVCNHQLLRWKSSYRRKPKTDAFKQRKDIAGNDLNPHMFRQAIKPSPSQEYTSAFLPISDNKDLAFSTVWLRDNCGCHECVHPETNQRIADIFSLPEDVNLTDISSVSDKRLKLTWSDGHVSLYSKDWLERNYCNYNSAPQYVNQGAPPYPTIRPFMTHRPGDSTWPKVFFSEVMATDNKDEGVFKWLQNIHDWGFCFVEDTPVSPEATEALLRRIAHIRETHYGGFWDFTADLSIKDTAYTNEALKPHTDTAYFTEPARLQLFHLLSHEGGQGGDSLLVDGFQAAQTLQRESPTSTLALNWHRQNFHASGNEAHFIQPLHGFPVLGTHPELQRRLTQIRWNNYDRGVKFSWRVHEQMEWYEAAKQFNEIISREASEIWFKLRPGTALLFDNWRMLHGRSAFTGKRRMCGGYIDNDYYLSRFRLLKFGRSQMLEKIGNP